MEFVTSQQGIDRIKKFESCRLTAYQDAAGDMDGAAREFDRWFMQEGKF